MISSEFVTYSEFKLKNVDQRNCLLFSEVKWCSVVTEAYSIKTFVLLIKEADKIIALVPFAKMGNTYISMPFIDYTEPNKYSEIKNEILFSEINSYFKQNGLKYIYRSNQEYAADVYADRSNLTVRLDLKEQTVLQWKEFSPKVRNQIRKAEKSRIQILEEKKYLKDFYKLWAAHISSLGTPAHSYQFFHEVFNNFPNYQSSLLVAKYKNKIIGGLILISDLSGAYVPWAAVDSNYKSFCVNHLLYWHAMQKSIQSGKKYFDFLRSQKNSGTYHFKMQWGGYEMPLYYYSNFVNNQTKDSLKYKTFKFFWSRMPFFITTALGPSLRKHIA